MTMVLGLIGQVQKASMVGGEEPMNQHVTPGPLLSWWYPMLTEITV